jgi:hypothetical protein
MGLATGEWLVVVCGEKGEGRREGGEGRGEREGERMGRNVLIVTITDIGGSIAGRGTIRDVETIPPIRIMQSAFGEPTRNHTHQSGSSEINWQPNRSCASALRGSPMRGTGAMPPRVIPHSWRRRVLMAHLHPG